jgi:rubrerythrin
MGKKELVEEMLAEETRMLGYYRQKASEVTDPHLRPLVLRLVEAKARHCGELEAWRRGLDASEEVTRQINDMFL